MYKVELIRNRLRFDEHGPWEGIALPPCASFADGYREMLIADAIARSAAAGGAPIDLTTLN